MSGLTLRASTSKDADFIYSLNELTLRPHVEMLGKRWSVPKMQEKCQKDAVDPNYRIVQLRGQDCGTLHVEATPDEIWLHALLLHPNYQHLGVGSQMMSMVLAQARKAAKPVLLYVTKSNPAKMFYERFGFAVCDENELHFGMRRSP